MKRITILGATGSIGQNTLDLLRGRNDVQIVALTGGRNIRQLAQDARDFGAQLAVTAYDDCLEDLRSALAGTGIEVAAGAPALIDAAARPADWIMSAIVGSAGLMPGAEALKHGTTLALANKETLVCAGSLVLDQAARYGTRILPVDSEHSGIFQCLTGETRDQIDRVILTASGGALRDWPLDKLATATLADAAQHPNWDMGQRITIDSASMFNKALEVIEAKELFGLSPDQVEVIIHPESIIHAMVGFADCGLMAHLGPPDMRHAIGYALNYPDRTALPLERLDFAALGALTFRQADPQRYPALTLAHQVMQAGGQFGAVFNAAKERALDLFIDGRIGFLAMADLVEAVLDDLSGDSRVTATAQSLEDIMQADHLARKTADRLWHSRIS